MVILKTVALKPKFNSVEMRSLGPVQIKLHFVRKDHIIAILPHVIFAPDLETHETIDELVLKW